MVKKRGFGEDEDGPDSSPAFRPPSPEDDPLQRLEALEWQRRRKNRFWQGITFLGLIGIFALGWLMLKPTSPSAPIETIVYDGFDWVRGLAEGESLELRNDGTEAVKVFVPNVLEEGEWVSISIAPGESRTFHGPGMVSLSE